MTLNIQEYISSGIIENHVLGFTNEAEAAELESMCRQYPEVRAALHEAEETLANYAQQHRKTPPASAKEKIFRILADDGEINEEETATPAQPMAPMPTKKINSVTYVIAVAASVLFFASVIFHLLKVADYEQEIHRLQQEKIDLIAQNETFMAQIQKARREISVIGNPAFETIVLGGVPGHDESRAVVYWNVESNAVYLKPDKLPALPDGKQYQLWGIVDGQPINAGVYDLDDDDRPLQRMASFAKAEMFAITIEKEGGSEQPTLDQMVAAAKL